MTREIILLQFHSFYIHLTKSYFNILAIDGGYQQVHHNEIVYFFIGVINKTANIEIIHTYKPSPPPTVRDYVNPKVGDKLYDTDNRYIQEWLTGNYL